LLSKIKKIRAGEEGDIHLQQQQQQQQQQIKEELHMSGKDEESGLGRHCNRV